MVVISGPSVLLTAALIISGKTSINSHHIVVAYDAEGQLVHTHRERSIS